MNKLQYIKLRVKEGYALFFSILAVLAMNCKMECISGGVYETALLNNIYKLYHSFYSYNFSDIFVMVTLWVLICYVEKQDIRRDRWTCFFSVVLSVLYVVAMSYYKYDSAVFLFDSKFQMFLSIICIAGYTVIIYYSLRLLIIWMTRNMKKTISYETTNGFFHRQLWCVSFFFIFVCWLPWIVMNYPGTSSPDATYQLKQYFADTAFTAHHPPLSTFIMGFLFEIGNFVWNANFGFFLYILLQTIFGTLVFSWSIHVIHGLGVRSKYCFLGVLYYALLPIWGGAMQQYGKDLLYTEMIALFVTYLVKIIITKQCGKKEGILLTVTGILAALLRNNGIYAVFPTMIILICYLKNAERKKMCAAACIIVIVYYSVTHILYPCIGIQEGSVREALSIPFMQTARYVNTYEDEVTEYEKEVIDSVLDYDAMEKYTPKHADSIKNTYKNDNSKLPDYFKVWFQMFLKHPGCYVEAFLNKGGGYLAPVFAGFTAPIGDESDVYIEEMGIVHVFKDRFTNLLAQIEYANMEMPVVKYFCMAGTYTWIVLVCILLLLREKIYNGLILLIPEIINILVCVASPTWHLRYALPVMAVVPLMIGWTYYMIEKTIEKRDIVG